MSIQINPRGLIGRLRLRSLSELKGEILNKTGRYIDGSYARVINAPIVTPFFQQGWGDLDIVDFDRDGWFFAKALVESKPLTGIRWRKLREGKQFKTEYELYEGTFESPIEGRVRQWMPPECLVGRVQLLKPKNHPKPALALHLAGTGDHGFSRRLVTALPLVSEGIAALILESPYYGRRRPIHQVRSKLLHVSDLLALGRTTIEEAHRLLLWAKLEGYGPMCLTGFSMGGVHAAMTACLHPGPVACAPLCAPHSAAEPYCDQLLWGATQAARDPGPFLGPVEFTSEHGQLDGIGADARVSSCGHSDWQPASISVVQGIAETARELARQRLAKALEVTDVTKFPRPVRPDAAIIVAAMGDGYVSPESVYKLHTRFEGSELRHVPGGHVTAFVSKQQAMRDAIADSIRKL